METPYRLAWLRLHPFAVRFLLDQRRVHEACDALANPERLGHHVTLWYGGACGPFDQFARDFPPREPFKARPIGIASDHQVEALVVTVAGHHCQHGSSRRLHITLSLAAGILPEDSVRLLATNPVLRPVTWPDLPGDVEYVPPKPTPAPSTT